MNEAIGISQANSFMCMRLQSKGDATKKENCSASVFSQMRRLELLSLGSAVCITSGGSICAGTQTTNAAVSKVVKENTAVCMRTLAMYTLAMTFGLGGESTTICLLNHQQDSCVNLMGLKPTLLYLTRCTSKCPWRCVCPIWLMRFASCSKQILKL